MVCKYETSSWYLNGFPDGSNIGGQQYNTGEKPTVIQRKIRTHLDLLSIPQLEGGKCQNVRWDQRLQIQNLFVAFERVPRWK